MRAIDGNGWDFVKVGETYQYKEDWFIAMVTILEDNSDEKFYKFKVQVEQANTQPFQEDGIFEIAHIKELDGHYSGMLQLYESPEYAANYKWKRE